MHETNPTTRISLILRLNNCQDAEAWEDFVAIYYPMIWRIAKRMGMSDVDASDAVQNAMLRLTQVVHQWSPEKSNATFRGWLYRVARNCMLRQFEKESKRARTLPGEDGQAIFAQLAAGTEDSDSNYQLEFQRQVFANAAEKVRPGVTNSVWQAFWLTYVKNKDIKAVAGMLNITVSAIYVARCRVLKRIRDEVVRVSNSGLVEMPDWNTVDDAVDQSEIADD